MQRTVQDLIAAGAAGCFLEVLVAALRFPLHSSLDSLLFYFFRNVLRRIKLGQRNAVGCTILRF